MKQGTVILLCGLPGSGKTTLAKKLSAELSATVMSPDQELYGRGISFFDEKARADIEAMQWKRALELAQTGKIVILENGFWGRSERDTLRNEAHALGLRIELRVLDVPFDELWRRVDARNKKEDDKDAVLPRERLERDASLFQVPSVEEMELFDSTTNGNE